MSLQTATLGAGCFWCVEAVYQDVHGVASAVSGYMGGQNDNPTYRQVCGGDFETTVERSDWGIPWGLNFGVVGLLPYLPLPSKLVTAVLPGMLSGDDEAAEDFAERVRGAMQNRLDTLTARRTPLIG